MFRNPLTYLAIAVALIVIFRKQIQSWINGPAVPQVPPAPAEGSACNLNGQAGTIVNGACVPAATAQRIILVPIGSFMAGRRRGRCYSKPAGAACEQRIYDPQLGWGSLYSYSNNSCCYTF